MSSALIKSILGGICIGIGGLAYLSVGGGTLGAFLFSIGLLTICMFSFNLFTGAICYVTAQNALTAILILMGNLIGVGVFGLIVRHSSPLVAHFASEICARKLSEGWRVIPLAAICNILIFIAVDTWKSNHAFIHGSIPSVFVVVLCVMVFILSGTEHSIANAFYFTVGNELSIAGMKYLGLNIVGNAVGGILMYRLTKAARGK